MQNKNIDNKDFTDIKNFKNTRSTITRDEMRKKRKIQARRRQMKRRRILFFVLVGLFVLIIIKIVSSIFTSKPEKEINTSNLGSWYIAEIMREKSGKFDNSKAIPKNEQEMFLEAYNKATGVEKRLMPGTNHLISADEYAYDTKEIRSYIRGEKEYGGNDKLVFLTFDDGPNNTITPQVLDILEKNNVHGTFFVVGKAIYEDHYDTLKRIVMDGNSIGLHSFSHDYDILYPEKNADTNKILEEARLTLGRVQKVFGENFKVTPWRYPGGHMSWQGITPADQALEKMGMEWIDWNSLSGDAEQKKVRPTTVEGEVNYIAKSLHQNIHSNVAVVLMHDATNKQLTVDSLQSIINYFKENNYKFCILK